MDEVQRKWDALIDMGVSEETLQTITDIDGYSEEVLGNVLYSRFGERLFEWER